MRGVTCAGTKTSKVPTLESFLPYLLFCDRAFLRLYAWVEYQWEISKLFYADLLNFKYSILGSEFFKFIFGAINTVLVPVPS